MSAALGFVRLSHAGGIDAPAYMTAGAAGADVCAAVACDLVLAPGARALVPTGFVLRIPDGFEVQVRPRSGLALRHGVTVLNAPGTIDADYRDEVHVLLVNLGSEPYTIRRGERIAQLVLAAVVRAAFSEIAAAERTARVGGFGSTG